MIRKIVRNICRATYWPDGAVRRVLIGPSAGLRYRIFPKYGLGPLWGRWEPHLQRLMVRVLKPGDVAHDVGGNYGIHTLLMARLVGSSGTVCSFEPHPKIFAACSENVGFNHFQNVKLLNVALSDRAGTVPFSLGRHEGQGHVITNQNDVATFNVKCETMDHLVATGQISPPTFIKIDVEGHESAVLAGAETTVAKHKPILAVDLHNPEQDKKVGQFLIRHGYVAYRQESLEKVISYSHFAIVPMS